jgi:2-haloacid dehalogenase
MPIQSIIFDFGAVLMQWDPRRLFRQYFPSDEAIEAFMQEVNFHDWNIEQDRGRHTTEAVALLVAQYPQYTEQLHAYDEHWLETIVGPIQGTVDILERLYTTGMPLYGLTNWSADKFPLVRAKYPFFKRFRDIIISGEEKLIKPDPALFQVTLRRIGRPAQDCLLIDDSLPNVQAARQLGMAAIQFQSPEQLERELNLLNLL